MELPKNDCQQTDTDAQDIYTFRREEENWYIDLPAQEGLAWTKQDLQMTEGAHKFLNRLAGGAQKLRLRLRTVPTEGAGMLELVEHCEKGGAIYLYVKREQEEGGELFWIYNLALFVFGDMPACIYVQRLPGKIKGQKEKKRRDMFHKDQGPVDGLTRNSNSSTTEYHQHGQSIYHQLHLR